MSLQIAWYMASRGPLRCLITLEVRFSGVSLMILTLLKVATIETAANLLYFYNSLEAGKFDEHQKDWVLVDGQKVVKYGSDKYTNQQLSDLEEEMPAAIYLPVDPLVRENYLLYPAPVSR